MQLGDRMDKAAQAHNWTLCHQLQGRQEFRPPRSHKPRSLRLGCVQRYEFHAGLRQQLCQTPFVFFRRHLHDWDRASLRAAEFHLAHNSPPSIRSASAAKACPGPPFFVFLKALRCETARGLAFSRQSDSVSEIDLKSAPKLVHEEVYSRRMGW
jgi:hypothetical protein